MKLSVGIMFSPTISFCLKGAFECAGERFEGQGTVKLTEGGAVLTTAAGERKVSLPLEFTPVDYESAEFELQDVVIGINFHWERKENQSFRGALRFIEEDEKLTAINVLDIEDYLLSVISSEMSATSSLQLLKAHAVISRSWLIAQIEKSAELEQAKADYKTETRTDDEYVRWFDREDHVNFDVCADDHCQRYQGINRASTEVVRQAIAETRGEVVAYNGKTCDARFSKCCGGVAERFENVWEPVVHPYLTKVYDAAVEDPSWDLTVEEQARKWITTSPEAFCNTTDAKVLSEVLNTYDQETQNFYRWTEEFTQEGLSDLIRERLGIDFGTVTDLIPVERGVSGRLIKLKVVGTKRTMTIGKELIIRKAFSRSHLYSSAFVVDRREDGGFILRGAGWGHGVGLCQIGAAVMGAKGYSYREILEHYFRGAKIEKKY